MEQQSSSIIDVGTESMVELEELRLDLRGDASALKRLFELLRTPEDSPKFAGNSAMSMLADVRAYPVLREATGISRTSSFMDYEKLLVKFLDDIESGVDRNDKGAIRRAKAFCSALVSNLIARNLTEIFNRKDSQKTSFAANALI